MHSDDNSVDGDETPGVTQAADMDAKYGARSGKHNLRARKPRSYSHLHFTTHQVETVVVESDAEPLATTQMSMKRGIKMFGQDAVDAVSVEIKQLHDRLVMKAKDAKELTRE